MGAYEKAKKAWQETEKKEREDRKGLPHLKSTIANENEDEDCENTEDEDSSDDDTRFCAMRIKPGHEFKPKSTTKHVAALTSTDNDVGDSPQDDVATQFSSWAHKVKVNKKPLGRQATSQKDRRLCARLAHLDFGDALVETSRDLKPTLPAHGIVVKTEKELNHALHSHPCIMTAIPANRKNMIKALKKAPGAHLFREGEVWAMVDSGAGVPGIHVDRYCSQLRHKLLEATKK